MINVGGYALLTNMKRFLTLGGNHFEDFVLRHLHLARDIHSAFVLPVQNQLLRGFRNCK